MSDDFKKQEPVKDERPEERIGLDLDKGYFRVADLSMADQNFLLNNGYDYTSNVPIGRKRQEKFLVKVNKIESKTHTFWCTISGNIS